MADLSVVNLLGQVRTILQDKVEPLRYTDPELLDLINRAMLELRRIRPDAFIGSLRLPVALISIGDLVPVDEIFFPGMTYYVAGAAELRDDSFTTDGRASILMKQGMSEWRLNTQ